MKKRVKIRWFVLAVLVVFLGSCSSVRVSLEKLGFTRYKSEYLVDLKKYTKSYTLYRDFSTIAKVTATHFNRKLFEEYGRAIFHTNGIPLKGKYRRYLREFDRYDIYYVAFYTPDLEINNLEDKNSFWNIYLSACGRIFRPVSIKWIDKDDWRSSWLYSTENSHWSKEYIVRFKKNSCEYQDFVISSFLGTISLDFIH